LANAAAGLLAAERVASLEEGVAQARAAVQAGAARTVLEKLRQVQ
jgi:anthranilate phosphoribosyltransferase